MEICPDRFEEEKSVDKSSFYPLPPRLDFYQKVPASSIHRKLVVRLILDLFNPSPSFLQYSSMEGGRGGYRVVGWAAKLIYHSGLCFTCVEERMKENPPRFPINTVRGFVSVFSIPGSSLDRPIDRQIIVVVRSTPS